MASAPLVSGCLAAVRLFSLGSHSSWGLPLNLSICNPAASFRTNGALVELAGQGTACARHETRTSVVGHAQRGPLAQTFANMRKREALDLALAL